MNLSTLYGINFEWTLEDKIEVTVGGEEKGYMTFLQALREYGKHKVIGFNKTQVWLSSSLVE